MHLNKNNSNFCGCSCQNFQPAVSYTIGLNSVKFTQSSTFDAGDSILRMRCEIIDNQGNISSAMLSGAGTGATAGTATFASGAVTGVPVTAGGSGYTVPPAVVFTGGGGTGATAVAVINSSGVVTGVTIINGGTGYTSAPTVTFVTNICEVPLQGLAIGSQVAYTFKAFVLSTGGCKADLQTSNIQHVVSQTGELGGINLQGDNNTDGNN